MDGSKLTQIAAVTVAAAGDYVYLVDDPGGTPLSRRITVGNLFSGGGITFSNPQGVTGSEAFGAGATVLTADSCAFGNAASATDRAVAMGESAAATERSVAIGHGATTGGTTNVAIGELATAGTAGGSNNSSIAIGHAATASGNQSTIIGRQASAGTNDQATGLGYGVTVGPFGTAVGYQADAAEVSIALGDRADASFDHSIAIGGSAATTAQNQLVIGGPATAFISAAYIGNGVTHPTPQSITLNATGGSGENVAGAAITIAGGRPTGTGTPGPVRLQAAIADAGSGTTLNDLSTAYTVTADATELLHAWFDASPVGQQPHIANATASHTLTDASETVDRSELEGFLDDLGGKINALIAIFENLGLKATS